MGGRLRGRWLAVLVAGASLRTAAAASSDTPAPGPVGTWWEDREVLLKSAWASHLGWSRSLPMCEEARTWNQSFVDAATRINFLGTCFCYRADSARKQVVLHPTIPIPNPRLLV